MPVGNEVIFLSYFNHTANIAKFRAVHTIKQSLSPAFQMIRASSAMNEGVAIVVEVIFLAIGIYVAAFILPGALTAIATTALTSVNSGVITLFQTLTPLIAVVVLILLFIAVVRRALA